MEDGEPVGARVSASRRHLHRSRKSALSGTGTLLGHRCDFALLLELLYEAAEPYCVRGHVLEKKKNSAFRFSRRLFLFRFRGRCCIGT